MRNEDEELKEHLEAETKKFIRKAKISGAVMERRRHPHQPGGLEFGQEIAQRMTKHKQKRRKRNFPQASDLMSVAGPAFGGRAQTQDLPHTDIHTPG